MGFIEYKGKNNPKFNQEVIKELSKYKNIHMFDYRRKKNLTQEKAATIAGISKVKWMYIENNAMRPTECEAEKICRLLNKNITTVFPEGVRDVLPLKITIKGFSKLKYLRVINGITQKHLSKLTGTPVKVIRDIENHHRIKESDLIHVEIIAAFFKLDDIVEVLGGIDISSSNNIIELRR